MGFGNTLLIIAGVVAVLIGIGTLFYPNLARFINAPGSPSLKAIIALITGIIILIVGLVVQIPG